MTRFVIAGLSLLFAVVRGVQWLGQPLRLVHLVTIIGLSMLTGVLWMQAVLGARAAAKRGER
jgi:hypothetical protein